MLVITRKLNEKLQIGENIIVQVINIRDDIVSLIITLPNGDTKGKIVSEDEEVQISDDVVITARSIRGKCQARLGITAPKNMAIKRIPN